MSDRCNAVLDVYSAEYEDEVGEMHQEVSNLFCERDKGHKDMHYRKFGYKADLFWVHGLKELYL